MPLTATPLQSDGTLRCRKNTNISLDEKTSCVSTQNTPTTENVAVGRQTTGAIQVTHTGRTHQVNRRILPGHLDPNKGDLSRLAVPHAEGRFLAALGQNLARPIPALPAKAHHQSPVFGSRYGWAAEPATSPGSTPVERGSSIAADLHCEQLGQGYM